MLARLAAAPPPAPTRRVVVTGLGAVTPLGVGVDASWSDLLAGKCGVRRITQFDASKLPAQIAAEVPDFDADAFVPKQSKRSQDVRFIALALAAAQEALGDAGWAPESDAARERTGVAIGSGIGSLQDIVEAARVMDGPRGLRGLSPFFVPRILANLAGGNVSINHGLRGPNHCAVTACATGSHAVGDAFRLVRHGDADVMLAGGTDASINELAVAGFCRLKALASSFNDDPAGASRPFDCDRAGFVMGEGAGVLVLEELEHARARGARIYAEVRGYGLSSDAFHITAPDPEAGGAQRAMRAALAQAGLEPGDVGYVNAHATSTPLGDAVEVAAVRSVFGVSPPAVSSTKGATGHLLGAAGAVEAIFCVKALHHQVLPPTINLHNPSEDLAGIDLVPNAAREAPGIGAAMSNSFGFGSTNASLVFGSLSSA